MHIEAVDLADAETIRACHDVYMEAQPVDDPDGGWLSYRPFSGWMTVGWNAEPREVWTITGQTEGDGGAATTDAIAGWYRLELPDLENLDRAGLDLIVRPQDRRRGLGRALLRHALGRAAAHGRSVLSGAAWQGTAGDEFARTTGAKPGLVDIRRTQYLGKLPAGELARLRGPAEQAAADYSLLSWTGPVPEEVLDQIARLYAAMADAPHDAGVESAAWDAQRIRERVNALYPVYGTRQYSVAARHDASGEMAALSQVAVDPATPEWGFQMLTAVTREHRGHRLGLLVKIAMLELLATEEPQLEQIETFNAEANPHMIAVNEALGYAVVGPPMNGWLLDVKASPGDA
jgi:GNAT superfamily N-acetyltransferase/RimJ/RimL family protein N-acetyltransferase